MDPVTLTQADAGRTVTVTPGQHVVLRLEENPTTGFRWSLPAGVEVVEDRFEPGAGGMIGAGGTRVLTFAAPQAEHRLDLRLQRPFSDEVEGTFAVTLAPAGRD